MESKPLDFTGLKIPRDYQITKEDKTKIYAWTITCNSDDLRFPVGNSNDDRADRNRTLFIDQI